jgi:hypothetical protein
VTDTATPAETATGTAQPTETVTNTPPPTPTATDTPTPQPVLTPTPTVIPFPALVDHPQIGPTGSLVSVFGWGFAPNQNVTVTFSGHGYSKTVLVIRTNARGAFGAAFQIPVVKPGYYYILTAADASGHLAQNVFRVVSGTAGVK